MDHSAWENCITTSLRSDKITDPYETEFKNPFSPRLRRLFKDQKGIVIGFNQHTIYVDHDKQIRRLVTKTAKVLIEAGWKLGDFNCNTRVSDLYKKLTK